MCTFDEKRVWSYAWDVMDDLSSVPREYIIDYLLERLQGGQIYTWVGSVLLAINPYDENIPIKGLYNSLRADSYRNVRSAEKFSREIQPHIFAVAARAHYRLIQCLGKSTQVIVLNGETGTGKTFNAWKALEFLVVTTIRNTGIQEVDLSRNIVRKIKDACRLISAFTTAPTEKNEASSRHVQVVWLEYKKDNICGAKISSYFLERNRVTKGYCTYQIFNQMMTALADIEFADTGLSNEKEYFIVSNYLGRRQFRKEFRDTLRAMDMLGFTIDQKKNIFQVLSLIIHMGNIRFIQEEDFCRIDTDNEQSKEAVENTCRLAYLKREDLAELLTSTLISPQSFGRRHSTCRRNLSTKDACYHRLHSIIRHLYDLLFRWLIKSVNGILSTRLLGQNNRLGILDIFGFECFNVNGIEQLCINYVNERLQQYFIEKYVISCRRDLEEENLIEDEEKLLSCNNILQWYEERLNAIKRNLFAALNDICLSTVPSNMYTLIRHVNILLSTAHPTTRRFLKVKHENFVICHYAGIVEYSSNDLLSKNTDKVPDELTFTFGMNRFLYFLIIKNDTRQKSYVKKHTMLSKLQSNVDWLIQELNECDAHYVRCIKPRRLLNKDWDRDGLHTQLANTGILHALPLAKCKYPIYFPYEDFYKRYFENCENHEFTRTWDISCKINKLLPPATIKDVNSSIHYGKNFIFLKEDLFLTLEFTRRQRQSVRKIESFWIKYRRKNTTETTEQNPENTQPSETEKIEETNTPTKISEAVASQNDRKVADNKNTRIYHTYGINLFVSRERQRNLCFTEKTYEHGLYSESEIRNKYIMKWLKDIKKTAQDTEQSVTHDHNQSIIYNQHDDDDDDNNNNNNKSQSTDLNGTVRAWRKKIPNHYDKENDMYIIPHDTCILFYKNGILSRRRPTKLPIKIHTHATCLTNSHYSTYMELPQGLQDCL